jgi:hypothetical protein
VCQVEVEDGRGPSQATDQDLREGDVHVLRYRVVRPLILREDVELI